MGQVKQRARRLARQWVPPIFYREVMRSWRRGRRIAQPVDGGNLRRETPLSLARLRARDTD
jgi:hypothetical protein